MEFRDFLGELKRLNWLTVVRRRVDWRYELGELATKNGLPMLFTNIEGYPAQSVFAGGLAKPQLMALNLGIGSVTKGARIVKTLRERIASPLEPVLIRHSPLKENVYRQNSLDINRFAVPWWSRSDGGRYIGTWHVNVTKNYHTGQRNVGVYRMQIIDSKSATVSVSPRSHLASHMAIAEKLSKPLEMAVVIGASELVVMAGAAAFKTGTDEYGMAGALMQKPLEIIKCTSIDSEVPARAEIVLEGELIPGVRVKDGPFMDYSGITNSNPGAFLFRVKSVMHRNNPVFRGTAVGMPGAEDHQLLSVLSAANLVDFHGSRARHLVQNLFLKNRMFTFFQMTGRVGKLIH